MFEKFIFHQAVYWTSEWKKKATLSNLQIECDKRVMAALHHEKYPRRPRSRCSRHTIPSAAIQPHSLCQWTDTLCLTPTYCLCPIQQHDVERYHISRCRGRGVINFMSQTSNYGYPEHSGDCPTLHTYDSQPNSIEAVNKDERGICL